MKPLRARKLQKKKNFEDILEIESATEVENKRLMFPLSCFGLTQIFIWNSKYSLETHLNVFSFRLVIDYNMIIY